MMVGCVNSGQTILLQFEEYGPNIGSNLIERFKLCQYIINLMSLGVYIVLKY